MMRVSRLPTGKTSTWITLRSAAPDRDTSRLLDRLGLAVTGQVSGDHAVLQHAVSIAEHRLHRGGDGQQPLVVTGASFETQSDGHPDR